MPNAARRYQLVSRRLFLAGGIATTAATAVGTVMWLAGGPGTAPHAYALAPDSVLPPDIVRASADVRQAYRFAIANQDTLRYIPCFCGCGTEGHTSNASCYLKDQSTAARLVFDRMSLGSAICVDITRDVMHLLDDRSLCANIRAFVDQKYSRFGPSTATRPVPKG